jgi:hypothetical protein
MKKIIIILLLSTMAFFSHAEKQTLSYKEFGHLPMIQKPVVSPDGSLVAAVFNNEEGPSIVVSNFGSNDLVTIVKLKKSQDRIDTIYWANNERLIISASYATSGYGDRYRVSRLFSVKKMALI